MKNSTTKKLCAVLTATMLLSAWGCGKTVNTDTESDTQGEINPPLSSETETEKTEESESETETETETEVTLPDSAEKLDDPDSNITGWSGDPDSETVPEQETEPETEPESASDSDAEPERIYNYLTGKTTTEEERDKRPVAIMINNIVNSLPQVGISQGEVYYECAAEGGITRIMMLASDYEKLGTVGSVRSSRDYFVDFLANHDAIYVHAGGSSQAYEKIIWRKINNIDGVNQYQPDTFWRDQTRLANMGYEHSLMTSGKGIKGAVDYMGYRTKLDEKQVPLFKFYDEETDHKLVGSPASHVHMKSTAIQTVDFVYNEETGEYLRYQYNGMPHVDGANGEQISVKNVFILFTDISLIPGDEAGRLTVGTVGSGQGYYITNGKRKVVNWSRDSKTSTLHMEYRNGDELIINSGKTFICVVDNSVARNIDFEYSWN